MRVGQDVILKPTRIFCGVKHIHGVDLDICTRGEWTPEISNKCLAAAGCCGEVCETRAALCKAHLGELSLNYQGEAQARIETHRGLGRGVPPGCRGGWRPSMLHLLGPVSEVVQLALV